MVMAQRVLLVEDDPSLRRVIELNLAARGYQVDVAATGTAALDLSERHPDLIVVDLGLPDMDGIDLITRLRASLTTPILAASARDARTAEVAALGAGADDYIAKPFGADQLMSRVRAILRRSEPPNGEPLRFSA
jgi:two-component system KDP operon response regulator KdpE